MAPTEDQATATNTATDAAESAQKTAPTGPVAFIKSHTTVLFRQKTRACRVTATSPRGHAMVCDRPTSKSGISHLLHAMVEQREGGVRVIFWRVVGEKAKAPRTKPAKTPKTPKAPTGGV